MPDNVSPFIEIVDMGLSASGKTHVWYVTNKRNPGDIPGIIRWHGPWRGYVYSCEASFYDSKCLKQIAEFLETVNAEHKK